jgi:hypothetical protein
MLAVRGGFGKKSRIDVIESTIFDKTKQRKKKEKEKKSERKIFHHPSSLQDYREAKHECPKLSANDIPKNHLLLQLNKYSCFLHQLHLSPKYRLFANTITRGN